MKTTEQATEMAPHIRRTLAEIDGDLTQLKADVLRLEMIREGIVTLYGGTTELPAPAEVGQVKSPAMTARPHGKTGKKPAKAKAEKLYAGKTYEVAAPAVPAEANYVDGEPETLAGWMKKIIRELQAASAEQVLAELKARCPGILEGKSDSAVHNNLAYWLKTNKLTGGVKQFQIADKEFFQS